MAPVAPTVAPSAVPLPSIQTLEPFQVNVSRIYASDVEGPDPIDHYDPRFIEGTGSFTLGQFLGTIPPSSAGSTQQLVLIDGVPTQMGTAKAQFRWG